MKETTSQRLKQLMNERNLKQVDIINMSKPYQKKLGVTLGKSALSQYVNGKSSPDQHKLTLLAHTLDVNEAWIMGYDVSSDRHNTTKTKEDVLIADMLVNGIEGYAELINKILLLNEKQVIAVENLIDSFLS